MKKMNKMVIESLLVATIICGSIGSVYASEVEDEEYEYTGPGITMTEADYDGNNGRIYSWGIGPTDESSSENIDLHYQEPTTVEDNITNPIDNSLIDMGPTSASNAAYTLHFINDGGPGMDVTTNELGSTMYYDDGGPGMEVMALSQTEDTYVDNGPTANDSTANPENYLAMLESQVPSNGEGVYRSYEKNTKASTK